MKQIIVFKESFSKEDHRIYKLDDNQKFYESLTEPGKGFSLQKTIDYAHGFTFFDTVEEAEIYIKEYKTGMVNNSEADIFCPKCGRGYMACDESEHESVWTYKKTCACDHTFEVEGRQIILYRVVSD